MNKNPQNTWKKGQSGNPKGAPKRNWTWQGELTRAAEEILNGIPIKEALAKSLIREGLKGNILAIDKIMSRMDGMPAQDITSGGEKITGPTVFVPKENEK